jgi:hypothetical protein
MKSPRLKVRLYVMIEMGLSQEYKVGSSSGDWLI